MTATKLDGKATLASILDDLTGRVAALTAAGRTPGLATVLVGDDPGSQSYVRAKHNDCAKVGIRSMRRDLPSDATQAEVEAVIDELNADPACTGYIVQLPLPKVSTRARPSSASTRTRTPTACTPPTWAGSSCRSPVRCRARRAGRRAAAPLRGPARRREGDRPGPGVTVGRPLGLLLTRRSENATVTLCHTGTKDVAGELRAADVVVAAAGVPGLVTPDMVKPGAAVLDVGITRGEHGLVGDVAPEVVEVASYLAPCPAVSGR